CQRIGRILDTPASHTKLFSIPIPLRETKPAYHSYCAINWDHPCTAILIPCLEIGESARAPLASKHRTLLARFSLSSQHRVSHYAFATILKFTTTSSFTFIVPPAAE